MNIAIIVGAGRSSRMESKLNKILLSLVDKPVICETMEKFEASSLIHQIILVISDGDKEAIRQLVEKYPCSKLKKIVTGGNERQDSVWEGIKAIEWANADDIVIIHNAANPLVDNDTIRRTIEAAKRFGASAAAVRAKDTIKEANPYDFIEKTLDRRKLWQMQTPQVMSYGLAVRAFLNAFNDNYYATDDVALVERLGEDIKIVECPEENFKITYTSDLEKARYILNNSSRLGLGLDSHRFAGRESPLVLGGVVIPDEDGLEANSDGDVVLHSLFNALSQAIGGKSLGYYADEMCRRGIKDSKEYIKVIAGGIKEKNCIINNIGIMIEAKRPQISDYESQMKESIASICGISKEQIGITATSGEGMTDFGKGLGIQVFTIVSLKNG